MKRVSGKREAILAAAVTLLAQDGPAGLSASRLAGAVGVSKANLFHHFPTLDDIVLAAFERYILGLESLAGPPPGSLREWLEALMAETTQSIGAAPELSGAYLGFAARARSDPRLRGRLEEVVSAVEAAFAEILATFRPELGAEDLRALAHLVLLAGDGLAIHRTLFPARAEAQAAAWRAFVDLVAGKEDAP